MRIIRLLAAMVLAFTVAQAAGFEKEISSGNAHAILSSAKPLVVGENRLQLHITQEGKSLEGAAVKVKFFMPAMPGMPYMEELNEAKEIGGGDYEVKANFAMGGSWQLHLFVTPKEGKKFRFKSFVNL